MEFEVRRLQTAGSLEALWSAIVEIATVRGARAVVYHPFHQMAAAGESGSLTILNHGFPEQWVRRYIEGRQHRIDPIPEFALRSTEPFVWADVLGRRDLSPEQRAFIDEAVALGLGNGLGIPVFGPGGRNGYLGLDMGPGRIRLSTQEVHDLQVLMQVGHLIYLRLAGEKRGSTPLSAREREVLRWIAEGKSNTVIAQIVGISPNTVDTIVRRIFGKLGVNDRVSAVARGLGSGLLGR
jgi:LuxR family transcriptional regulator/LuxR family quorum-sensing system transcriptional regulator CciR